MAPSPTQYDTSSMLNSNGSSEILFLFNNFFLTSNVRTNNHQYIN